MSDFGSASMTAPLRRVVVRRPPKAMASADPGEWHYTGAVDIDAALAEHDRFVSLLKSSGVDVDYMDDDPDAHPDSLYTHDPSMATPRGAVIARMGKKLRRAEAALHEAYYRRRDIPLYGAIEEPGTLEAGDTLWIDASTLAVGRGFRTNDEGIRQLKQMMAAANVAVEPFDLPCFQGEDACLHLMSLVSLLADDLALVHMRYSPVRLLQLLVERGYNLVPMPEDEFLSSNTISGNVLAIRPRTCLMVEGLGETQRALEAAGCTVRTFKGREICIKPEGGPTCLTRPVHRGS